MQFDYITSFPVRCRVVLFCWLDNNSKQCNPASAVTDSQPRLVGEVSPNLSVKKWTIVLDILCPVFPLMSLSLHVLVL
jgi:hypothetical protein